MRPPGPRRCYFLGAVEPPGAVLVPGVVDEPDSVPVNPRPPLPVAAAVTRPLSHAAMNSAWLSFPSLFGSAAFTSFSTTISLPCRHAARLRRVELVPCSRAFSLAHFGGAALGCRAGLRQRRNGQS